MINTTIKRLVSAVTLASAVAHGGVQLRDYQADVDSRIVSEWEAGAQNVLAVMPTGAGKTVLFSHRIMLEQGASCAIAHRQELVGQICVALARNGVRHRIIAPQKVIREIVALEMEEVGASLYDPSALCAVAGVDTLVRRHEQLNAWLPKVRLWVMDEAHHLLTKNKWGVAVNLFPNARGLGVTATPERADGCGLGKCADGVFDTMVVGPSMRDLINRGYLTDYDVVCPLSDIDMSDVTISEATGDYNQQKMINAVRKSRIVGDVVTNYMKFASGTKAIVFTTDVETAGKISKRFNDVGIPAEAVSAKTPSLIRNQIMRRFKLGELKVLVNVDLFGEGFDLPAIQTVIMARPTKSYSLYAQQFGRALRIMEGKERALIIDHVANIIEHNLPDMPRAWSLMGREKGERKKKINDAIPLTRCLNEECNKPYEKDFLACPYCGHVNDPGTRGSAKEVEGDLVRLSPEVLQKMRGEIDRIDGPAYFPADANHIVRMSINKKHVSRQEAQARLRSVMQWWAGFNNAQGIDDRRAQKRFFLKFGADVLSAQTLGSAEADELAERVTADIIKMAGKK